MRSTVHHHPRALVRTLPGLLRRVAVGAAAVAGIAAFTPRAAAAQWVTTFEQFYYPAEHNWVYRDKYPFADRLFNAFDYGHSILYEELYTKPNAPASRLEGTQYDFLTKKVLPNPPRVPLEEAAIEIQYARLAPEAKQMFEWAHVLHRQAYDILADERLSQAEKDGEMAKLLAYYKSRPDIKFSSRPKSMELMQEQPYSLAFRKQYPKFNGLIWGYHWLQVGLYEPLVVGKTFAERQALSTAAVARFRQMLENPPETMPYQMPMTAAVAPAFTERYPEFAIIFDNLHSMHDVVSDILANDSVPRSAKRAEIVRAGRLFRDDTSYVMPVQAWRTMARAMGIENMGGPAVGFTTALPTPSVTYGAVMEHDEQTGRMVGMKYGRMTGAHGANGAMSMGGDSAGGMAGMDHRRMPMPGADTAGRPSTGQHGMDHSAMGHAAPASGAGMRANSGMTGMHAMHMRMMADPVIRRRMLADTAMRRMVTGMLPSMPAEQRAEIEAMLRETDRTAAPAKRPAASAKRAAPRRAPRPAAARPARPAAPTADPHAGHTMPPSSNARPAEPPRQPARKQPASVDHSKMGHP